MSDILIATAKALTGTKGTSWGLRRLKHFSWLPKDADFLTMTPTIGKKVNPYCQASWNFIAPYKSWFEDFKYKAKDYGDVWEAIDVSPLAHYKAFAVLGLVYEWPYVWRRAEPKKSKCEGFPRSYTSVRFKTVGAWLPCFIAIAKASQEYKIPIHALAFDPDEYDFDLWDPSCRPYKQYLYHGYDTPFGHHRLDSALYYWKNIFDRSTIAGIEKEYDFVLGCTILKGYMREDQIDHILATVDWFKSRGKKVKLFLNTNVKQIKLDGDTFCEMVPHDEYLKYVAASKFTMMLPSCNPVLFSPYRFFEDLAMGTLPLFSPGVVWEDFSKSFGGYDLSWLSNTPSYDMLDMVPELQSNFMEPKIFPEF